MKTTHSLFPALLALAFIAHALAATDLIIPQGFGDTESSGKANLAKAFDQSLTKPLAIVFDGTNISPSIDIFEGAYTGANEFGYIDFGENFARIRIAGTMTSYFPYTPGTRSTKLFQKAFFTNDYNATDPGQASDVTEINFGGDDFPDTSDHGLWKQSAKYDKPITPSARYLVFQIADKPTDRVNQLAIIGETVVEPLKK